MTGDRDRGGGLGTALGPASSCVCTPESASLSLLLPGSWAQAVLTQPPSESGSLGQRVTLSCTGSSSNIGGGNSVNWSQPLPGKVPRSVFTYANLMAIAAPDQFSGFKSGSSGTLTITGLQAEDDAEYYCTAGGDSLDGPTVPQARGQVRPKPAVPQPGTPWAEPSSASSAAAFVCLPTGSLSPTAARTCPRHYLSPNLSSVAAHGLISSS